MTRTKGQPSQLLPADDGPARGHPVGRSKGKAGLHLNPSGHVLGAEQRSGLGGGERRGQAPSNLGILLKEGQANNTQGNKSPTFREGQHPIRIKRGQSHKPGWEFPREPRSYKQKSEMIQQMF